MEKATCISPMPAIMPSKNGVPASGLVTTLLATGLKSPGGVAVDGQANVYISNTGGNSIKEYTAVYLSLGTLGQNLQPTAGSDSIPVQVLPANTLLTVTPGASWLNITGTSGGAINFSFQANTSINIRSAQITVLGESVTVTQLGDLPATITKTGGYGQSAAAGQPFASALQVQVKDAAGNGVQGAQVIFTVKAGAKGASGTFTSSPTVVTAAKGSAASPQLIANNIAGTFTVTASVGRLSASFTLTVTAP